MTKFYVYTSKDNAYPKIANITRYVIRLMKQTLVLGGSGDMLPRENDKMLRSGTF